MPTYIPIYRRRLNPQTGQPEYDSNGKEIVDLIEIIEVPDEPVFLEEPIVEETPIDPNDPTLIDQI
jgi:hypothetical protein